MPRLLLPIASSMLLAACAERADDAGKTPDAIAGDPVASADSKIEANAVEAAAPKGGAGEAASAAPKSGAIAEAADADAAAGESARAPEYFARMRAELRNLLSAQEVHFSQHIRYAGPTDDVNTLTALGYTTDDAVRVRILEASDRGWSGVALSDAVPGRGCAVYLGAVAVPTTPGGRRATGEGTVTCDD